MWQISTFHSFLWASGGCFSDYYIHQIDECSWMKGAWPVQAHALGGRHYRGDSLDQNFDTYDVEYTYPDGTKLFYQGRNMDGCTTDFSSYAHGTKGSAIITTSSHTPGKVRTFKGQLIEGAEPIWRYPQPEQSPYQLEWEDLVDAIRNNKPYNEVKRGAEASLVTSMGRMAAHTGQYGHLRADAQLPARDRPGRGQVHDGFARSDSARCRRQVPRPAARHRQRPRIQGFRIEQRPRQRCAAGPDLLGTGGVLLSRTIRL